MNLYGYSHTELSVKSVMPQKIILQGSKLQTSAERSETEFNAKRTGD